ncbi:MAG: RNA methyltransferase [Candidatus Omnitrophica bacterium]|nr:RNA methyltransferase [Candidatus Omnitrophota bacterium]
MMKLFGKNPVLERLRANPQSIRRIFIQQGLPEASYIHKKARQHGIQVIVVAPARLEKINRTRNTQGVLVDVDDFAYVPYDDLLETARDSGGSVVFLDSVTDPQNLGAIIRSLACLGGFAVVLPTHDSVGVTEAVLRVASGGDNYVAVARVANLGNAIRSAKESGFWIAGAVAGEGQNLFEASFPSPVGLVVGSEQKGIRDVLRKLLDAQLTIPMSSATMSFNVAHATAIFCYEIAKQKKNAVKK